MTQNAKSDAKPKTSEKWIETGYELFARDGHEGIAVERMASLLNLNKSGFYHYFQSQAKFLNKLMQKHRETANQIAFETSLCRNLDPDYFLLILNHKAFFLFQGQLLRRENITLYKQTILEVETTCDKGLLPLERELRSLKINPTIAYKCFDLYKNSFYLKANHDTLDYKFLQALLLDAKEFILSVLNSHVKKPTNQSEFFRTLVEVSANKP